MEKLDEPMQLAFSKDGRVYFAERRGSIIMYDPKTAKGSSIGTVAVFPRYEDGLLGLATDPAFLQNRWLYVFYTAPSGTEFHISRFTLDKEGKLDQHSEKVLLKIPKDILDGSHTGGSLMFDPRGNGDLFITVGDNTSPRATGFAPIDERDGRMVFDAQRSAGNTNDLRGKILRIHPEPDGTYTIPEGNLFPKGTEKTRPEIYTMGHRQPWRIFMDRETGWLYEGEVGPDAEADSADRGPLGLDEFNLIKGPGNYGWPYFLGDNKPYHAYDFSTGKAGPAFDPSKPENHSRYNTGLTVLPPAQKAFIWYPYSRSKEFPLMGTGARCATGGPVFHQDDYPGAKNVFPPYYEGKWFITDWIRGSILVVSTDRNGQYRSMEPFMPEYKFTGPLDMQFGPDGSLYVLEYGSGWFQANDDARLLRIDYNGGNRKPVVKAHADKRSGALPVTVHLSSAGTKDYDTGDRLSYSWKISLAGREIKTVHEPDPEIVLNEAGNYTAVLTVTDDHGASDTASVTLEAGNEAPEVQVRITNGNQSFYFPNTTVSYAVSIKDKEDGTITHDSNVMVSVSYLPRGIARQQPEGKGKAMAADAFSNIGAQLLINGNDCYSCHAIDRRSAGPAFREVAERYKGDAAAADRLSRKIISGGSGNWGQASMSAHPDLSLQDARLIASYILTMTRNPPKPKSLPLSGQYKIGIPPAKDHAGVYLFQASYTDKGGWHAPAVTGTGSVVLRNPVLLPSDADESKGFMQVKLVAQPVTLYMLYGPGSWLGFRDIDLTGIRSVVLGMSPAAGTAVELHLDSPEGALIGSTGAVLKKDTTGSFAEVGIKGIRGRHNLYFVCQNPKAAVNDFMMTCTRIEFRQ
jgi:cytochrome c